MRDQRFKLYTQHTVHISQTSHERAITVTSGSFEGHSINNNIMVLNPAVYKLVKPTDEKLS